MPIIDPDISKVKFFVSHGLKLALVILVELAIFPGSGHQRLHILLGHHRP